MNAEDRARLDRLERRIDRHLLAHARGFDTRAHREELLDEAARDARRVREDPDEQAELARVQHDMTVASAPMWPASDSDPHRLLARWPCAENIEVYSGSVHFTGGPWDEEDRRAAERAWPGWQAELGEDGYGLTLIPPP